MNHKEILDALEILTPNAKFILNDLEITWMDEEIAQPDVKVLQKTIQNLDQLKTAKKTKEATAKATAEGKLAALGLDLDDLRALGL